MCKSLENPKRFPHEHSRSPLKQKILQLRLADPKIIVPVTHRERERERERERQTDRQTERQTDRETETEGEREGRDREKLDG